MQTAGNTATLKIVDKTNNGKPAGTKVIISLPHQYI
jgi:hypothetical protein